MIYANKRIKPLSFANLITADRSLSATLETTDACGSDMTVFGISSFHSFPPHGKTAFFTVSAHQFNDLWLFYTKLKMNGFKRGAVFPGHFNDSVDLFFR